MAGSRKNTRQTLYFGEVNTEAIKLIAKLGAAPETLLRCALEDQQESKLKGRWTHARLVVEVVGRLERQLYEIPGARRSMEEALIHYGLWAGAKRST